MNLCEARGKFLYEARPDLFPEGYLTQLEVAIWNEYYRERNESMKANKRG